MIKTNGDSESIFIKLLFEFWSRLKVIVILLELIDFLVTNKWEKK